MTHVDWQLGNWIRSSQQNSGIEGRGGASESPTRKHPPPTQSSKHSSVEVVDPTRESKPQLSFHQKAFTDSLGKPQQYRENPQDTFNQQRSQKSPSADVNSCSRKVSCTYSSVTANADCQDRADAALIVKCEEVVETRPTDPCFKDRPKVKTKTGHGKKSKDSGDAKRDSKRTSKHTALDKRKAGSEPDVPLALCGSCPACGVGYPNPCSCPTQNRAQPDKLSPAPSVRISCSKPKSEKSTKTTHKHPGMTGHRAKSSRDSRRPPKSLLVKIDLSLLSRVPQTSFNCQQKPSDAKRTALVREHDGGGNDAPTTHKLTKTSKKSIPQNVRIMKGCSS